MPANKHNGHSDLGVGIGLRIPHYRHILEKKPLVDWFEIIAENYMVDGGRPLAVLDQILEQYRVVVHGVGLYFGSTDKLDREHLKKLKKLLRHTRAPWFADHLCWGSADGRFSHDLLPIPYTAAAAKRCAAKIRQASEFLEIPIAVENVSSYLEYTGSVMTEWEFLTEVVERADCGILLDVNNIYVSSENHKFDPLAYLNGVPAGRVAQMHVAGHRRFDDGFILDTHDHAPPDPVWDLYEAATRRCGVTNTLLEWDDNIPSFEEVHREAMRAHEFIKSAGGSGVRR